MQVLWHPSLSVLHVPIVWGIKYDIEMLAKILHAVVAMIVLFFFLLLPSAGTSQLQSKWQASLHGGLSSISGDVKARTGVGGGFSLQRNINNVFAIRADYTGSINKGLDVTPRTAEGINDNSVNDPWHYLYPNNRLFVANYRAAIHRLSASAVASIFNWHVPRTAYKLNTYGMLGYSLLSADVSIDAATANEQPYNYAGINFNASRKDVRQQLKQLMDGRFDRVAYYKNMPYHERKKIQFYYGINAGLGFGFSLNEKIELGLERRLTVAFSDHLDGIKHRGRSDLIHYTSLQINYKFGSLLNKTARKLTPSGPGTMVTSNHIIHTVSNIVNATVRGEAVSSGADTNYYFILQFKPAVPGNVSQLHSAFIRLETKQVVALPYAGVASSLRAGKEFSYRIRVPREALESLAANKATELKIETSTFALEDRLVPGSQSVFSSISNQLLRH
ncbi:hypothetical protein [Aridibaculum aurantiacum]|uniref:hypothetical protein n=1 Tax=Aridibaculum aurantiacum TaxID=2810307 RepID=UPI001A96034B|nr:hypothetical protein [Aridibaculum aurantiacum]